MGERAERAVEALVGPGVRQVQYFAGTRRDRRSRWEEMLSVDAGAGYRSPSGWMPAGAVAEELARQPHLADALRLMVSEFARASRSGGGLLPGQATFRLSGPAGTNLPGVLNGRIAFLLTLQPEDAQWFVPIASANFGAYFGTLTVCAQRGCGVVFLAETRRGPALCPDCLRARMHMSPEARRTRDLVLNRLRHRRDPAELAAAKADLLRVARGEMPWPVWRRRHDNERGDQGRPRLRMRA